MEDGLSKPYGEAGLSPIVPPEEVAILKHRAFTLYKDSEERVISGDRALSRARLARVAAVRQIAANGLTLLGVSAPERM